MQFTTTALLAALGLSSLAVAAPAMDKRDSCANYPWFIAPYADSYSCQGNPATYQPTSGPYNPSSVNSGCLPLSDPSGPAQGFESVSINRDACPQQVWAIQLYTEPGCAGTPQVIEGDSCVPAPEGQQWQSFEAVVLAN